jgi:hypothetical protein
VLEEVVGREERHTPVWHFRSRPTRGAADSLDGGGTAGVEAVVPVADVAGAAGAGALARFRRVGRLWRTRKGIFCISEMLED